MCVKDVKIIDVEVRKGHRYADCKANVKLECDGHTCTEIVYPVQDDRHLTMLMKDRYSGEDIPHSDKLPIREAIQKVIQ
ncbi:MAG: hypothetical protein DRO87_11320 [Candidatus Thorarchaeota archaeon]|nr:MAG: hypothetical protein DRO87_11320 [Candidatus Thorarchaeota archaeon]